MPPTRRARIAAAAAAAAVALATGVVLAEASSGSAGDAAAAGAPACGPATVPTLQAIDARVMANIYGGEVGGSETHIDLAHVSGAADLLAAVAAEDRAATLTAVQRIVYHHFWHIVRLRVLDAAGRLLADFGGPYVIAPVAGTLVMSGKAVGSFVMSVQDDVGFTKLERHAVGDPIGIYVAGRLVAALGATFPKALPAASRLRLDGTAYALVSQTYNAFPTGTLTAVLAVAVPPASVAAQSCAAVNLGEVHRIVLRIASLFHPLAARYGGFAETAHSDIGVLVIVRIGPRVIAGSGDPGPVLIPLSGTITYGGRIWSVFSFAPTPPARVYVLVAQAP